MASKVAGWRQCRKHPRWLVVTTLIWVVGASVAAGAGAAEHATAIAAAAGQENGLLRQTQAAQNCTATCGDTDCTAVSIQPFDCRGVMGNGWFADWRKQYFSLPGRNKIDNGLFCCTRDMQYAFVATCADTDSAGTPFNCQETLGNGWVLNNDTAGEALVYDDVLDAIKCCTQPVDASDPVDLYLESDDLVGKRSSGLPWIVESVVGDQMEVTVNVGVRGLGQGAAKNANMRAFLPGFHVVEIAEEGSASKACTWQTDCPVVSHVTCSWSRLDRSQVKKLTLTLRASDAGASNSVTGFFTVNATNVDSNPDNNEAHMTAQLKAACCDPGGGCQNLARQNCKPLHVFSPASSCADSPCIEAPSPSRDTGPAGICILKRKCLERVKQLTCLSQSGRWRNARTCKNVRIQSLC